MADRAAPAQESLPILNPGIPIAGSSCFPKADWVRIALIGPFVLLCYAFDWNALRSFNCTVYLAISHTLGIPALRVSPYAFLTLGHIYFFATACTAIEAFFGSIPLLWEFRKSVAANLSFFAIYAFLLFGANILRLAFGMLMFVRGVPWRLSHEAMAGCFYFAMFIWIAHRRGWSSVPPRAATA